MGVELLPPSPLPVPHGEAPHVSRSGLGLFIVAWPPAHPQPCPPNLLSTKQPQWPGLASWVCDQCRHSGPVRRGPSAQGALLSSRNLEILHNQSFEFVWSKHPPPPCSYLFPSPW